MTAGLPRSECSGSSLYIINLCSSTTPMALEAPSVPELDGFAVFRSRRLEDGRDRFRLHLGYFDSQEQAENLLPLVRDRYPAAWVALAPQDSMGSLDDTSVAQFKLIQQRKPAKAVPIPAATPGNPATAVTDKTSERLPQPQVLAPQEVLSLLESEPRKLPESAPGAAGFQQRVAEAPVHSAAAQQTFEAEQEAPANGPQQFAVQLVWSKERIDTTRCPQLAIFEAYTLYTVQVQRNGERWYGLRLGFFGDPISARQVALYARSDFAAAAVVPVSERECDRAGDAAKSLLEQAAVNKADAARADEIKKAATQMRWLPEDKPAESTNKDSVKPAAKPPAKSSVAQKPKANATDYLRELESESSFNTDARDELNDTGVRHLRVSVVKRAPTFGRLLARIAGR